MPSYKEVSDLYKETISKFANPDEWQLFLRSINRNYKFPFVSLVLLYAQKPDAVAVLEIDKWKKLYNRWKKPDAQAIAILDNANGKDTLRYYYDITETVSDNPKPVPIWTVNADDVNDIKLILSSVYGNNNTDGTLFETVAEAMSLSVEEYITDNSSNIEALGLSLPEFKELLTNSTILMFSSRLGLSPQNLNFDYVTACSSAESLMLLGSSTRNIAEKGLSEIGKHLVQKSRENRTFESIYISSYNSDEKDKERSNDNGNNIFKVREHTDTEYNPAGTAGGRSGILRTEASEVPERESGGNILNDSSDRSLEGISDERGQESRRDGGTLEGTVQEAGSGHGEAQAGEPNGVGSEDEQHQSESTRNRDERNSLSSESELPPLLDNNLIQEVIFNADDSLKHSKKEINDFFALSSTDEEKRDYVKTLYSEEHTEFSVGSQRVGFTATENGLLIWEGTFSSRTKESVFSWSLVAELIEQQIDEGRYYNELVDRFGFSTDDGQIGLFDILSPSSNDTTNEINSVFNIGVSQQIIDEALCLGSNEFNSTLDIAMVFRRDRGTEYNANFLKKHYGTNGAGFFFDGEKISLWYDADGLSIAKGETAQTSSATHLTWEQAAKRIRELLDLGRYMPQSQLDAVDEHEADIISDRITTFYRDMDKNSKERCFPSLKKAFNGVYGYPDGVKIVKGLLSNPDTQNDLTNDYIEFMSSLKRGSVHGLLRYANQFTPEYTFEIIKGLSLDKIKFNAQTDYNFEIKHFITSDEINNILRNRASGFAEGKYRIYTFFVNHPDLQERADMLKHEYGIGGSHSGNDNLNFDAKGLSFSHRSLEPYSKVDLKWTDVARRIDKMIKDNAYYYPEEIANLPEIEKEHIAEDIERFFEAMPSEYEKPYSSSLKPYEVKRALFEMLGNTKELDKVEKVMSDALALMDKNESGYKWHLEQYEHLVAFKNGEYHPYLVPSLPEPEVKPELIENATPSFVSEYNRLQADYPNAILFIRLGDFYEVMGEKAKTVSDELDLVLTGRTVNESTGERTALVGVPAHTLDSYVSRLIAKGYTVAIAENEEVNRLVSPRTQQNEPLVDKALGLIQKYKQEEFGYENEPPYEDFSDIGLAFTETEDGEHTVEVNADLLNYKIVQKVDGEVHQERKYNSLEELIDNELYGLSFDDLVFIDEKDEPVINTPSTPKKVSSEIHIFDSHPEIPLENKHNFNLVDKELEPVGKKERFRRNIAAINVVKECEFDGRLATPEEQEILSQYVGWGGIPEAFDENNAAWADEYKELIVTLSPDEYDSAKESTLTAFYTPQSVISAMYKALQNLGFKQGNILEPACGIGNFIGMLPEQLKDSNMYGIELDNISAQIARQLYQRAAVLNSPFEKANLPDSFFDVVIGNVPFGDFKVVDKKYDKYNFLIHDYFFAKSLDKLRPGGVMMLITSEGTMDKENPAVRKYIAQRAELLGAIRLPNTAFKGNAGTEVVSDILILQKRDTPQMLEPDWVFLDSTPEGHRINSYFVEHPEMVLGEIKTKSGRFGEELTVVPHENKTLEEELESAISNITGQIELPSSIEIDSTVETDDELIPADPNVRNFSFTVFEGSVYYRENSVMRKINDNAQAINRLKGLIKIRDYTRELINAQLEGVSDTDLSVLQTELNTAYDEFTKKYGLINSRTNLKIFDKDSSSSLISTLEILDDKGELVSKADLFTKRTIKPHIPVTSVDTASEALAVSIGEKGRIDMEYMMALSGKTETELFTSLKGVIFLDPLYGYGSQSVSKYLMADEYLSGNVREKLIVAKRSAELYPDDYGINVEALEKVQPKDLTASEISVRLGSTWLPVDDVADFMYELLGTPTWARWSIKVDYSKYTSEWRISHKTYDNGNVKATSTYGTSRMNAYRIIEETLNLRDARVYDYIEDIDGKKKQILNVDETAIAQSKQEAIKERFQEWIWSNPERRNRLCKLYNERFNSTRPREYDGSHINFVGMTADISLRPHQRNAIAHILYGGNTLLAHAVGAGKTFEMVAAAQESKRLGLCTKSLFVVPNHLTEQWAEEYLRLYPAANILVATKKDFETKNRKRFCSRIATGDYDAVIIGHSQFEKIPVSVERQRIVLQNELNDIIRGIEKIKNMAGQSFSVKQLERSKKSIKNKLEKLNDQSRKDDVVTFEELGVDRLFIDESHYYKNLFLFTKMRNVGGVAQTEAQKSSDLYMKCRYLDEITGGKGVVFATGTPISNSMVELYTIQRYLQYNTLVKNDLQHFDAWASTFGETVTAIELTPEGTGYRAKTRFAKFHNLPELMSMFKEVADIKTADTLNLPVPKANYHNISVKPSQIQKDIVKSLSDRADKVRNGNVDSSVDNMLLITNDGRKLALDQRLINDKLPDFEGSKVNACANTVFDVWERTADNRSTQLLFCDLSTPKDDKTFSVYTDIRSKLIEKGIPQEEIAFIHDAKTEAQKKSLFDSVCEGKVRILIGSTSKMGAGTNVQDRLIALHDLDCPWRPSDLEQRSGRIIRQGNSNEEVEIYRYVTEETFDAYLYQLVESKQKFISQIMTSKSPVRSAEDVDEAALSYAEIKMLATGNPLIKEKMDLDIQVQKLKLLKSNYLSQKYSLEDKIVQFYPQEIARLTELVDCIKEDMRTVAEHPKSINDEFVGMMLQGKRYSDKGAAGEKILSLCSELDHFDQVEIGTYRQFKMLLSFDLLQRAFKVTLKGKTSYSVELGNDNVGCITRLDNLLDSLDKRLDVANNQLNDTITHFDNAKEEVEKPFEHEEELTSKLSRLDELNILLNLDKPENEIVSGETLQGDEPKTKIKEKEI